MSRRTEGGCGDCELLLHSQGASRGKLLGPGTSEEDEGRRVGHVRMDRRREKRESSSSLWGRRRRGTVRNSIRLKVKRASRQCLLLYHGELWGEGLALDAGEVKAAKDSWIEERTERRERPNQTSPPLSQGFRFPSS